MPWGPSPANRGNRLYAPFRAIRSLYNAHPIRERSGPGARTRIEYDHTHHGARVRFYAYEDAAKLLADFWLEAEATLERRSHHHEYS